MKEFRHKRVLSSTIHVYDVQEQEKIFNHERNQEVFANGNGDWLDGAWENLGDRNVLRVNWGLVM